MGSPHYTPTGVPSQGVFGNSKNVRDEFALIETGIQVMNSIPIVVHFEDFNSAGSRYVVVPWNCKLIKAYAVNAVANTTLLTTLGIKVGGTAINFTETTWRFEATDPADTVKPATFITGNAISLGASIEVTTNAGGSSVMPVNVTLIVERT